MPSKLRIVLAAVTISMASHSREEIFSLKRISAIREVATISKLFNRDTLAEVVLAMPSISKMGATISNITMATV